jgi:carnitine 3-dehydrogenase
VYLLPLVEVCGGEQTSSDVIDSAMAFYETISMKPLHVRVEIDAFIADRLLEAVWRESLWLVNDGVATTEEIDDAIRYGFGLRWAQMGIFETYRVAGGEGGMAHFVRQFGPTLSWPWTKLTDVPELTDELIETIGDQSDEQSGAHSIRELERIRDTNLVGILRALEANEWGAGETLARQRRSL